MGLGHLVRDANWDTLVSEEYGNLFKLIPMLVCEVKIE
jgi:hypothetical protein